MDVSEQSLRKKYQQLTDQELLELWQRDSLTSIARSVLYQELLHRGMIPPQQQTIAIPSMPEKNIKWVTIARLSTAIDAHILRICLEGDGIAAVVIDEHLVTANWLVSNAIGGVRVQVADTDYKQAKAIIDKFYAGEYDLESHKIIYCPKCGSDQVTPHRRSWKIAFLSLFIFTLPLPFSSNQYRCQICGATWRY